MQVKEELMLETYSDSGNLIGLRKEQFIKVTLCGQGPLQMLLLQQIQITQTSQTLYC